MAQGLIDEVRANFRAFRDAAARSAPFVYVWGPCTTHRGFAAGSGATLWGLDEGSLQLPPVWPNSAAVREDVCDYLGEVQALDAGLGALLSELEARGELDNTVVVVTGDHGMPMPRAKATLYEEGCRVPLAVRWPAGNIQQGHTVRGLVNTMDLAPTLCECAGVPQPAAMGVASRSLLGLLRGGGDVEPGQDWVVSGLERHVSIAREGCLPYPQRSLRTPSFLFIQNFEPSRWPAGDPHGLVENMRLAVRPAAFEILASSTMTVLPDCDASPSLAWMVIHRNDPAVRPLFLAAFGRRPGKPPSHQQRFTPACS